MVKNKTIFIANNISDVFYHLKSVSDLQILGGSTYTTDFSDKTLTIRNIPELTSYERKEHYFTFGTGTTLSQILSIGRTKLPVVLYDAIQTIATPSIRNVATIGGNICAVNKHLTLFAPLLALDARLEFQNSENKVFIPISKFTSVPKGMLLTKVRIPVNNWDVAIYRRLGPEHEISPLSAGYVFLADNQINTITNVRIVLAGDFIFKSTELENMLIGKRLPLGPRIIQAILGKADELFSSVAEKEKAPSILKTEFINLLHYSLEQLT